MILPSDFIVLHGETCSAVLELAPGEAPLWRYWGPRIADAALPTHGLREERPLPSFSLDHDQPLSIAPLFGVGWFGASALLAHREGQDFAQAITHTDVRWIAPGRVVSFLMTDAIARLTLEVTLEMDVAASTLILRTALTNHGDTTLDVSWLAAGTVPLPSDCVAVHSTTGRHNREFVSMVDRLDRNGWSRENRRGLTSHDAFPGATVATAGATAGATEPSGLVYSTQLAWSGNHAQKIEWLDDGRFQWSMGEWLAPGELRLAPGSRVETPDMLATCSVDGFDGAAQNFHRAIRHRMDWPGGRMPPRPVHLNTWEGFYFDHRLEDLKALADCAAEVGVERFVLDDGWFHKRHDDRAGLGDWWPDADKYPDGLGPLADHVVGLGMAFGLWVEPEMINPDSDLYHAHPDWCLHVAGRPRLTARNQLVLDLGRDEVFDYLLDKIGALLDALPIRYLKWDHNRDLSPAGSGGSAAYRGQVLAAWRLMDAIRERWPDVEIEACAGGGGRIDAGIARRTHRFWTSDCIDAVSRVEMQRGFLQFMPPELMGSHIGAAPAHSTGRSQALDFRAAVAMTGHLGVEFDLRKLTSEQLRELSAWISFYRQHRDLLHSGKVWRGEAGDGLVWQAHGDLSAGPDGQILLFVYRMQPAAQKYAPSVRLPMLRGVAGLKVERLVPDGCGGRDTGASAIFDGMAKGGAPAHGDLLARSGLPIPPMHAEACAIFRISREHS